MESSTVKGNFLSDANKMAEFALSSEQRARVSALMRQHSITYWTATQSFPRPLRDKVMTLYSWVRLADEIVDNPPVGSDPATALGQYKKHFDRAWSHGTGREEDLLFVWLAKSMQFEKDWCYAFLDSMKQDLTIRQYKTWQDVDAYVYGSADVIGLMMARILGVADSALPAAQALGRWMQYVNFLRDVGEDWRDRKRIYIPMALLKKHGISVAEFGPNLADDPRWFSLCKEYLEHILEIKKIALTGISALPRWAQFPVYFATVLYQWALEKIMRDPSVVWHRQVKPSSSVIVQLIPEAWVAYWRGEYK